MLLVPETRPTTPRAGRTGAVDKINRSLRTLRQAGDRRAAGGRADR
jgi:hypothetical protein